MAVFAEVEFKGHRKEYFSCGDLKLLPGTPVIVQADRGEDLGRITAIGAIAERKCSSSGGCATPMPERQVIRPARPEETAKQDTLRLDEDRVRTTTR